MDFPWLSAYEQQVSHRLAYPDVPLPWLLQQAAEAFPKHPALTFMGRTIDYCELLDLACRFANALTALGIEKGDRVALMLPNIPQYVISYYGALMTGAIVVQTNPLYTERELLHHLRDSGAKAIVCLDLVYPKVRNVRDETPLAIVIATGIDDFLPFVKKLLYPFVSRRSGAAPPAGMKDEPAYSFSRLLSLFPEDPVDIGICPEEDIAVLQYTGGTTGTPKGVMLTHANLMANAIQCEAWMYRNLRGEGVILAAVPLFHVYGMTVCMNYAMLTAARLVLLPRFDATQLLKHIHRERPTMFPGAPTMYIALLNHPRMLKYDLSSITCCISGSAPLPLLVKRRFEKLIGGKLVEGYGLSEASPVTHVNPIWGKNEAGSIGIPWPDTEAAILDPETGEQLGANQIGELTVKGPQVMKGYWNQPEATAAALQNGWLRTGDMAYRDEAGYFYIVDRKKEMINASGLKVYPREVEEVLYEHEAVQEAAVIGVPDEYRGETVKAFIVRKSEHDVTAAELTAFCRERLAPYKVPRQIEFRGELPKSMVGKVLRRALAEEERSRLASAPDGNLPGSGGLEEDNDASKEESQ